MYHVSTNQHAPSLSLVDTYYKYYVVSFKTHFLTRHSRERLTAMASESIMEQTLRFLDEEGGECWKEDNSSIRFTKYHFSPF